jgi:hypothetical protein
MSKTRELIELEDLGWQALSSGGNAAVEFYGPLLADDSVMIFPGGMLVRGKNQILETMDVQPWQWYELEDQQVIALSANTYAVVYKATAKRTGQRVYEALISSIYVFNESQWELVLHQQSPI